MRRRILVAICVADLLLHRLGVRPDHQARFFLARRAADTDEVVADLHRALGSSKDQAFTFLTTIYEVHPQAEIESLAIIEQSEHHIIGVAAIFPEAQSTRGYRARRTI